MDKYSIDEFIRRAELIDQYTERFGEEALPPYIEDMDEAVKVFEQCLEENKTYEELLGVKFDDDLIY